MQELYLRPLACLRGSLASSSVLRTEQELFRVNHDIHRTKWFTNFMYAYSYHIRDSKRLSRKLLHRMITEILWGLQGELKDIKGLTLISLFIERGLMYVPGYSPHKRNFLIQIPCWEDHMTFPLAADWTKSGHLIKRPARTLCPGLMWADEKYWSDHCSWGGILWNNVAGVEDKDEESAWDRTEKTKLWVKQKSRWKRENATRRHLAPE